MAAEYEALVRESERREAERGAAQRRAWQALEIEAEVRAGTRPEAEVIPLSRATGRKRRAETPQPPPDTAARAIVEQLATLSSDNVDVMYRPMRCLTTNRAAGLAATARWRHPVHGVMGPGSLMAAAEQAGLRTPLEERLLDSICADLSQVRGAPGGAALTAYVPLSARYLTDDRLPRVVDRSLRRHDLPGEALVLQIGASGPATDLDGAERVLGRLPALGVGLGLESFGTAPGGLRFLTRLPIGTVTLDESLTAAAPGSRAAAVLTGLLAMAPGLNLTLVADGVRDEAQAARLGELGIDLGAGPLYGGPALFSRP